MILKKDDYDKRVNLVIEELKKDKIGRTIKQLSDKTKLTRSKITDVLKFLEGNKKVKYRVLGVAKIYELNKNPGA